MHSVATNKGEFEEELTTERREKWIKATCRGHGIERRPKQRTATWQAICL